MEIQAFQKMIFGQDCLLMTESILYVSNNA